MGKKNKNGNKKDKFQFVEMDEKNLEVTKTISLDEIQEAVKKEEKDYKKNLKKGKSNSKKTTTSKKSPVKTEKAKKEDTPKVEKEMKEKVEVSTVSKDSIFETTSMFDTPVVESKKKEEKVSVPEKSIFPTTSMFDSPVSESKKKEEKVSVPEKSIFSTTSMFDTPVKENKKTPSTFKEKLFQTKSMFDTPVDEKKEEEESLHRLNLFRTKSMFDAPVEDVREEKPKEVEKPKDDYFFETIEEKKERLKAARMAASEEERVARLKKRLHFSFEARVTIMVICILLLFSGACLLIYETVRSGKNEIVYYDEVSNTSYSVCLLPNETYHQECLEEDMEYLSELTNTIGAYFRYNVKLSTDISYDLAYHVAAVTKIYDADDPSKVLYRTEDILVEKTQFDDVNSKISIDTDITLDFQKYNRIVKNYQNRYALNSAAEVEAILYLDEATETRKIASIIVPLGKDTYHVEKNVISNKNQHVEIDGDFWNSYNTVCAIIASVLILISLFLLYQTARLVLKVTTNHNKYQQKLSQILRDYDRIIVIARNGYESNVERQVVKLESFEELLDAQETLQKPIIYSRINDVKSEFIVEDEDTLYRYVLKESNY